MQVALNNIESLKYFGPELVLVAAIILCLLWDLVVKERRIRLWGVLLIALASLAYSAGVSVQVLSGTVTPLDLFGGTVVPPDASGATGLTAFDQFSNLFRALFALVTAVTIVFIAPQALAPKPGGGHRNVSEMITLLVAITLGLNLMAQARHLLMIYLSLEMVSVLSFVLAGFKIRDRKSSEGALKYVIYGGVASGIMLYGMSWIYGLTGSLNLGEIWRHLAVLTAQQGRLPEAALVGVVCMLAGFGYKISAAPFHMWTPDVYEGAPTPVTAFLSVGPKAAGFAVLIRFFADALGAQGGLALLGEAGAVEAPWVVIAGCLAMATMTVGNLSALKQSNVKRMLAYSSIAHAGYMLLGFSVFSDAGIAAIAFYVFVYCFMNLGAFLVVMAVAENTGGDESIGAFQGLGRRAPVLGALMAVFLFSLAGIPPLAGFAGKFYLFAALIRAGGTWAWVLALVGVLNSVISLFYYARVLRAMYLDTADAEEPIRVRWSFGATTVLLAIPVLVFGVYWAPLYDFVAGSLAMIR
ncbi:MAG: NADH-quinone oxidoreductase subunit N [Deltaproteobacteria bacterium]|nr:NADH-quinone oxidoreductase subunit N [Deltaproteobacteria bacterium]MBW2532279.1 NADH-quinone oxidoreductase subunit N [Deltaproteobacteria bacterium]